MDAVSTPAGPRPPPRWSRYAIALGLVVAFVGARVALGDVLADRAPLLVLLLAPMLAAYIGGLWPGVLATVLAAGLGELLFVAPRGSFVPPDPGEAVRLAVFVLEGIVVSWLIETRRTALERAQRDRLSILDAQQRLAARERRVRETLEAAPSGMVLVDGHGRIVLVNRQTERLFGYSREELTGAPIERLVPIDARARHVDDRERFQAAPETRPMGAGRDLRARRKDGSDFPAEIGLNTVDGDDGPLVLASVVDVTERRAAVAERERLHHAERDARRRTERLQALTAALAVAAVPGEVVRAAVEQGGRAAGALDGFAAMLAPDASAFELVLGPGITRGIGPEWRRFPNSGDSPIPLAVRTGEPVWSRTRADVALRYPALAAAALDLGVESAATLPLATGGRTFGTLSFAFGEPRTFGADERAFLVTVAEQCAQALERTRLFERERTDRRQLETMLSAISDAFFALDRDWRFTYVNTRAEQVLGVPRGELIGRSLWEAFEPARGTTFESQYRHAMRTLEPVAFESHYPPLDAWFQVRAYPGDAGLSVYFQDVTERHRMQAALERGRARLQAIIDGAPAPIYLKDREGRYAMVNEAQLRLLGRPREQVIGRSDAELMPAELAAGIRANDLEVWDSGEHRTSEEVVPTPGHPRRFRSEKFLLREESSDQPALCGVSVDVTDLRAAEAAAREATVELESRVEQRTAELAEANAELQEFAHTVAHDLRAPLRNIQGLSTALLEDEADRLTDDGRLYARRIADGAVRMDCLISDLLAYSRISRSQLRLEDVGLSVLVRQVIGDLAPEIAERGARIAVAPGLPAVRGHRAMLAQVLANLLGNAIKFVAPGVAPEVSVSARTPDADRVELAVADNGIGIAPEHHDRVFAVFERLHGQESFPGTGIGLAIVRKGVERMHGRIRLESRPGHGSRFIITLPAAR